MPANFPEVWLDRVIQNLNNADEATFLQGIPDLSVPVQQINEGQASEMNKIYVPTTEFEVDILVNNNTYPIPFQEYSDDTIEITLDKYQTKVVTLSDDDTIGASYDKIDVVTGALKRGITVEKHQRAIHSIAPLQDTVKTPVIIATGSPLNGRPMLKYEDLVEAQRRCKGFGQCRLVLNSDHWNDLLLDRDNFGNLLIDYAEGKPKPVICGFEIHKYDGEMPLYSQANTGDPFVKVPYGGTPASGTQRYGSVIFRKEAIAKKTGFTKQYFLRAKENPTRQSNDLSYRHYYIVTPFKNERIGAII